MSDTPVPGPPPAGQLLAGLARLGQAVRMEAWRNAGPHNLSPLQADIVTLLATSRAAGTIRSRTFHALRALRETLLARGFLADLTPRRTPAAGATTAGGRRAAPPPGTPGRSTGCG